MVLSPDLASCPTGAAIASALGEEGYAVLQAAAPGEPEVLSGANGSYRVRIPEIPVSFQAQTCNIPMSTSGKKQQLPRLRHGWFIEDQAPTSQ